MSTLFVLGLNTGKLTQAICWTLVHSLWQGLLLTIAAFFVISVTRGSKATVRYNLLTVLFILFIAGAGVTFFREIQLNRGDQSPMTSTAVLLPSGPGSQAAFVLNDPGGKTATGYFQEFVQYLNDHAFIVVAVWFLVFSIKLARMIANISYIRRIRRYGTFQPSEQWMKKLNELASALGIRQSVNFVESAIVQAPMVVGFLKPIILTPLGLLANLPPQQIEAILLHELAHIRRQDYFVNLLQSFAEVVFFFNPATIWVSSLIREERENCCDDITIRCTNNKKQFVHALVAFQEYLMHKSDGKTIIAFAGQKKYLLNRVKRIVYNENKKLNAMEKGIFMLSVVAICFVGLASLKPSFEAKNKLLRSVQGSTSATPGLFEQKSTTAQDTVPGSTGFKNLNSVLNKDGNSETRTITATDNSGKKFKIVAKNDEPTVLYVDGKKIPQDEIENYRELISTIEAGAEDQHVRDLSKMKIVRDDQQRKLSQLEEERVHLLERLNAIDEEKATLGELRRDKEWENAATSHLLGELKSTLQDQEVLKQEQLAGTLFQKNQGMLSQSYDADQFLQKSRLDQKSAELFNNDFFNKSALLKGDGSADFQLERLSQKLGALENDRRALEQQQLQFDVVIDPIVQDMVEQGILPPHTEAFSFELDSKKFIVNDKTQPAEVFERFRRKYVKAEGTYFKFSRKNGNTNSSININ